jgi:hypothetical protein
MDDQAKRDITHKQTPPKVSSEYVIKSPREALTLAQQEKRLKVVESKSSGDTTRLQTRTNKHQQPASFERTTNPIEGSAHDARTLRAGTHQNVSVHTRFNRDVTQQQQQLQRNLTNLRVKPNMSNSGSHRARQLVLISRKIKGQQGTIVRHCHTTHLPKLHFVIFITTNNRTYLLLWRHCSRVMNSNCRVTSNTHSTRSRVMNSTCRREMP